MQVETLKPQYTPTEYLQLEESAEYKSEYRDGEIVAMTGGTSNHNQIALNFAAYLLFALRGQNYKIYIGDMRLWIPRYRQYTYPDVMVIDGKPIFTEKNTTTVTNPSLIVEVLSKYTKNYDLGDKFIYYRSIPEFREYILIDRKRFHVMQYSKTEDGKWLLREYESEDAVLALNSINFEIKLHQIYEGVDFTESED